MKVSFPPSGFGSESVCFQESQIHQKKDESSWHEVSSKTIFGVKQLTSFMLDDNQKVSFKSRTREKMER